METHHVAIQEELNNPLILKSFFSMKGLQAFDSPFTERVQVAHTPEDNSTLYIFSGRNIKFCSIQENVKWF